MAKAATQFDRLFGFEDLAKGFRARDAGMALALKNEQAAWRREAMLIILKDFPFGWEGLAEEFQLPVKAKLGPPHVPQVWSAMAGALIKMGHFEHVPGAHEPCRKRTSHACDGKRLRRISR